MRRPGVHREIPPPLELACLKSLWTLGEGNVKAVREALTPGRNLAYTTVMTVLDRLARKGFVGRRKVGRAFVYSAAVSREAMRRAAVKELTVDFFDGSEPALAAYLRSEPAPAAAPAREPAAEERIDTALL